MHRPAASEVSTGSLNLVIILASRVQVYRYWSEKLYHHPRGRPSACYRPQETKAGTIAQAHTPSLELQLLNVFGDSSLRRARLIGELRPGLGLRWWQQRALVRDGYMWLDGTSLRSRSHSLRLCRCLLQRLRLRRQILPMPME